MCFFSLPSVGQVNDGPCTTYLGSIGSGNYVKMVHNGVEYGDMQLIAEVTLFRFGSEGTSIINLL